MAVNVEKSAEWELAGGGRNRSTRVKPAPLSLYPQEIPNDLISDRIWAAAVGSRLLTGVADARRLASVCICWASIQTGDKIRLETNQISHNPPSSNRCWVAAQCCQIQRNNSPWHKLTAPKRDYWMRFTPVSQTESAAPWVSRLHRTCMYRYRKATDPRLGSHSGYPVLLVPSRKLFVWGVENTQNPLFFYMF